MKKIRTSIPALCLALALLLTQTAFASDALGSFRYQRTVELAAGTSLSRSSLWSATYSDLRTERYLTYTPNHQVTPVVYAGTYITDTATVAETAAVLEGQGYRVVGAVNGGFFNTNNTAVGMLMSDGVIRALDRKNHYMVGFGQDGSVFVDDSEPVKTVSWSGMREIRTEGPYGYQTSWQYENVSLELAAFNTTRKDGELCLFSDDFGPTTRNTVEGVDVVLRPLYGDGLRFHQSVGFTVVSVTDSRQEGVALDNTIPAGCYVLSVNKNSPEQLLAQVAALTPGTQVTVSVTGVDSRWSGARHGLSALYALVDKGEVVSGLETGAAPRTAIGLKADGSVIFYTIDGRQSGYSVGASYTQVAQRLIELGCVTAVALDGGGSTALGATLPGSSGFTLQSRPSGGGRKVHNCVLLVSRAYPSGVGGSIYVDSEHDVVLAGADLSVEARGADTNGYPYSWLRTVEWSAADGFFWERMPGQTVYTAPLTPGSYTLTATDGSLWGRKPVQVVDTLSALKVERGDTGEGVSALAVEPGAVIDLNAAGRWYNLPVAMGALDVSWAVEGGIGTVDAYGLFWAGELAARGAITATAGGKSVTIPVTVNGAIPFTDVSAADWYYDAVVYAYQNALMTGVTDTLFSPSGQLTRGQTVTILWRMEGEPMWGQGKSGTFSDVPESVWYTQAVEWAAANGIVTGYGDAQNRFGPQDPVTRQQLAAILYRYAAHKGMDTSPRAGLDAYEDGGTVADYARPALEWAVGSGVVTGTSPTTLSPEGTANRAQAATMFQRMFQ